MRRHAGRPPGASGPTEHLPREHHPPVIFATRQQLPAGERADRRLPHRVLQRDLLQDERLQSRRGHAEELQVRLDVRRADGEGGGGARGPRARPPPRRPVRDPALQEEPHATVAAGARGTHPQRARAGGAVPAHVPRHHGAQAAHRRRRSQRRAVEVREAGALGDALALRAGVGAAGAEGAAAPEPPRACDVAVRRRAAAVPAGGAEDAAAHPAALLRLQGHLGLDHPVPHLLHRHHGALQRRLQEQDQRGRVPPGDRLDRGRGVLHRHRAELPHDVRGPRRRGGLRPQGHPQELLQVLVPHRPALVPALRRVQRVRPRRGRHRQPVQRAEGGAAAAAGPRGAQAGPLPGVRRRHADPAAVLLHAGGSLAGVRVVLHRALGRRLGPAVLLAVEAGQRDADALLVRVVQRVGRARAGQRALAQDHVRDRALLHHDLHDLRGLRQRRRRDR